MNDYKENLKQWAKFATCQNDQAWGTYQENLTKEELQEMLNILAGYLRASKEGRALIMPWLKTAR